MIGSLLLALLLAAPEPEPVPTRLSLEPAAVFSEHLYAGAFSRPRGVFFDRKHKELWIADTESNLLGVFTPDGVPLYSFGGAGLLEPFQVAVDGKDRVLVVDNDRTKIKIFSYRGDPLGTMDLPGIKVRPAIGAMTVDEEGNLWVGENATGQVLEYGPDGKTKLRFGTGGYEEGQFQAISGIAVTPDAVIVADAQVTAVQVFDRRGNYLRGWGKHDIGGANFSLPQGIAVDAKGRVFVVDMLRHEIKVFDPEGKLLDAYGGLGFASGALMFPAGIAFDGERRLFVVERGNSRAQILDEREVPAPSQNQP